MFLEISRSFNNLKEVGQQNDNSSGLVTLLQQYYLLILQTNKELKMIFIVFYLADITVLQTNTV